MSCERIRPLLSDYHDDALSPKQRDRVRAHVASCASCRAVLEGYDRLYATVRLASAPAPADVRRNVYAQIAQLERARTMSPLGPGLFGALRTAGGTAGLLAVLGGLILAAMRLTSGSAPVTTVASAQQITGARTAVTGFVDSLAAGRTRDLPPAARTAVASTHGALAGAVPLDVGQGTPVGGNVSVPFRALRIDPRSSSPRDIVPMRADVAPSNATAVIRGVAPAASPSPVPTLGAGDGLVYLHEGSDDALRNVGYARADVWFHAFAPAAPPTVLATPAPGQLFTGVTAGLDGRAVAYAAMGLNAAGGVFGVDPTTRESNLLLALPDADVDGPPGEHRFVKRIQALAGGHMLFGVVDQTNVTSTLTINITGSEGLTQAVAPGPDSGWDWFDYAMAPKGGAIAWTERPSGPYGLGRLDVITRGNRPVTTTVGMGAHPVWSPNGTALLYESDSPTAGLYTWSASAGSTLVVPLTAARLASLGDFTWSPNSRYFAYVLYDRDDKGRVKRSTVWLGDTATGATWESFADSYIGPIAWARMPAAAAGAAQGAPTATPTPASPPPPPFPRYANTDTPADTVHSFYSAINWHEFTRAFSYLSDLTPAEFRHWEDGYATTARVTLDALKAAPYAVKTSGNLTTCVAVALTARHTDGTVYHFGGWYMVKSTNATGQAPHGGWRIVLNGTNMGRNRAAAMPRQSQCVASARNSARPRPLAAG